MADISSKLAGMEMDENQRKVVDVFTGASDNESITVQRSDGSTARIIMRKGNEAKGGTKHSLFRHYGTTISPFKAEDILVIPEIFSSGEKTTRTEKGKLVNEYQLQDEEGNTYHVITSDDSGREAFITFYKSNEVSSVARPTHSEEARAATDNTSSTGKVTQISPTDQTNPQQSATEQGKNSYSSPQGTDRYSIFGGNKGYVGYSMSKRAEKAREEGRYPKTDFKREYKVAEKSFTVLSRIGVIESGEWHHTSKYGNRTTFHKWEEPWTADAYLENKAEIDRLCKQYDAKLVEKGNIKGNWPETAPEYNRLDAEMEAISDQIRTIIDTSNARAAYEESERQQQEKLNQQLAEANRTAQLRKQYEEEVVDKQPVLPTLDMGDGWTIQTNGSRQHADWQYFRNGNEWKYFNSRNKNLERDLNERADQMISPSLTFEQWRGQRETANNNEQGTDRYSHDNEDKKNTALTESTGQSGSDASSGGLVRSAHNIPTDTQGVPFDSAKVRKNTQSTKTKIKKFNNGDASIKITGDFQKDSKEYRDLLSLKYQGNSNYAVYDTPAGRLAFRLASHNARGDNFARDNADQNISVYVALNEYDQPASAIRYTEYRISPRDYARHKDEFAKSLIESVGTAIETGTFPQPRFTEKVVDGDRDAEYQKAVEQGDWEKVDMMLREEARLKVYTTDPDTGKTVLDEAATRREAVNEYMSRLAEKTGEFTPQERTFWETIKNYFLRLLRSKGFRLKRLTDDDLRNIIRESRRNLERTEQQRRQADPEAQTDRTQVLRTSEPGAPEPPTGQTPAEGETGTDRHSLGDAPETFQERQKKAVENNGTVMPGLNEAWVKIVEIPKHTYTGNIAEATAQAEKEAKAKYAPEGKPRTLTYDNFGKRFEYSISGGAIHESLNPKQQAKSVNKGAHLSVIKHLDEVINNSIEAEEHPDYQKNKNGERDRNIINENAIMHRFYGAITIDGKTYRTMTLMREDKNPTIGDGVYAYEVQKVEVSDEQSPNTSSGAGSHSQSEIGSSYPLANLLRKIEKSYDPGKFLLGESENSPTDQTNSQKSATEQGKNSEV